MNNVSLFGRLTKDLEVKNSTNNKKFAYFTLAVDGYKDKVNFINCVAWEKVAENMEKYVGKGSRVLVNGKVISKKDKDNNIILEINCQNVIFIDPKKLKNSSFFNETKQKLPDLTKKLSKEEIDEILNNFDNDGKEDEGIVWD